MPVNKLKRNKRSGSIKNSPSKKIKQVVEDIVLEEQGVTGTGGVVLVCGDGMAGQLGMGEDVSEKSRPAVVPDISDIVYLVAGGMHSVCLTKSRTRLITFGCNDEGALGRPTAEPGSEFVPGPVDLPLRVVQLSAGDSHTAVLLEDNSVLICGAFRDSHGMMGLLTVGKSEQQLTKVPINAKICKIASGSNHLVMLSKEGHVFTMGCGEQGQLGRVTQRSSDRDSRQGMGVLLSPALVNINIKKKCLYSDIWAGAYCTYVKEKNGRIYAFGLNNYKQLGLDKNVSYYQPLMSEKFNGISWAKISVGEHHAVALDSQGKAYVIGRKDYGRLGLGQDCEDAEEPTVVPTLQNEPCIDVACGSFATFALSNSGKVFSWGMGSSQLGQGAEEDLPVPTLISSKALANYQPKLISAGGQHLLILATKVNS